MTNKSKRVKALSGVLLLGALLVVAALALPVPATGQAPVGPTVKIMAIGDSITEPCASTPAGGWCARLGELLAGQGITVQWSALGVPGARCKWLAQNAPALIAATHPDVVLINCGTNDDPKEKCWGESCTAWGQRVLIEAAHGAGARVATAFVGYPDLLRFHSQANQEAANDAIYSNLGLYQSWGLALANFQTIPGNPDYLPDGIHPTSAKGVEAYAREWHRAGAAQGWWPALGAPTLCGLFGRRMDYPVPAYTSC